MMNGMSLPLVILDRTMPTSRERDNALSAMGEEEFRAFYERTARPLWSYLSRITGDRQQADDLLQEAYYRFYRAAAVYENETHRRNSLFRIATNLARDEARRASRYHRVSAEADEESLRTARSDAPIPERQAAIRTDLARAMQRLEPLQRELLWLAYVQRASHQEIGKILGLRAISIRTLLLRARRKLVKILTEARPSAEEKRSR